MSEFALDEAAFAEVINELVPEFQRQQLLAALQDKTASAWRYEELARTLLRESRSPGQVGLTGGVGSPADGEEDKSISYYIKREIYDFLCSDSARYKDERKEGLLNVRSLVSPIAAAVVSQFSLPLAVAVGPVTLLIMASLKIGTNAYCEANKARFRKDS